MNDMSSPQRIGKMVQYQQSRNTSEWHTFHFQVRVDEYEYFLDLRKLLKMSVSLILAYAVEKYLDKLMRKFITDNYRYQNYIIIKEVLNDIICWKFIWGFPPDIGSYISRS